MWIQSPVTWWTKMGLWNGNTAVGRSPERGSQLQKSFTPSSAGFANNCGICIHVAVPLLWQPKVVSGGPLTASWAECDNSLCPMSRNRQVGSMRFFISEHKAPEQVPFLSLKYRCWNLGGVGRENLVTASPFKVFNDDLWQPLRPNWLLRSNGIQEWDNSLRGWQWLPPGPPSCAMQWPRSLVDQTMYWGEESEVGETSCKKIPNILENTRKRHTLGSLWSLRIKGEKQSNVNAQIPSFLHLY